MCSRRGHRAAARTPGQRRSEVEMTLNVLDKVHKRPHIIKREQVKREDDGMIEKNGSGIWKSNSSRILSLKVKFK